jgi:hypothetical protein
MERTIMVKNTFPHDRGDVYVSSDQGDDLSRWVSLEAFEAIFGRDIACYLLRDKQIVIDFTPVIRR